MRSIRVAATWLMGLSLSGSVVWAADLADDWPQFWPHDQHLHAGGYEVAWLRTVLNGRLYVRTYDSAIACYDLRRK